MDKTYIKRLAENELERKLNSSGCVLVKGPKFCGKSTLCERFAKSTLYLKTTNSIDLANADPYSALEGEKPHLIDEWQKAPEIWNIIKDDLDKDYEFGKYLITGSTTPVDEKKIQHSGAGRISELMLRPLSLYESSDSNGLVSLRDLFELKDIKTQFEENNPVKLKDIAYLLCRGGWPISIKASKEYGIDVTKNYFDGLFRIENESDEYAKFLENKDIELLKLILKSYSRNISTQVKKTKIIKDIIESGERSTLTEDTFNIYTDILKKLFIIYDMEASNFNLRTSVSVRKSPTIHFVDTSIATASLGIVPNDLLNDLKSFGYFFEDMAVRDLSIYAQANNAKLKHYRDSSGQEVDAIVELNTGDYAAIEIKISSEKNIEEGIKSLNSFESKMKNSNIKTPRFKMILTSHGACYKDKSGIYIVPISCLKD